MLLKDRANLALARMKTADVETVSYTHLDVYKRQIKSISDLPPVSTDVPASDESRLTTVALDFGEMALDGGDVVRLYGVPGQGRFEFIWPMISDGAIGALFFLDARHPAPLQ